MPLYEQANLKVITCVQKLEIIRIFFMLMMMMMMIIYFFSLFCTLFVYFGL